MTSSTLETAAAATPAVSPAVWRRSLRLHWLVPAAMVPADLRPAGADTLRAEVRVGFRTGTRGVTAPCCELLLEGRPLMVWGGGNPSGWGRAPGGGLESLTIVHDTGDVLLCGEVRRAGKALRWKAFLGLYRAYAAPLDGTRDAFLRGSDTSPAVPLECDLLETDLLLEAAPWLAAGRFAGAHFAP